MWNFLKLNFLDKKFLRQKPLENFIVDFYCASNKIIIEIDGEVHLSQKDKDRERDNIFLQKYKIGTIRFTNNEVFYEKEKIKKVLKGVGGF
jgi:very-short-patch-repair endonuclease